MITIKESAFKRLIKKELSSILKETRMSRSPEEDLYSLGRNAALNGDEKDPVYSRHSDYLEGYEDGITSSGSNMQDFDPSSHMSDDEYWASMDFNESDALVESEIYVDEDGYAHDEKTTL